MSSKGSLVQATTLNAEDLSLTANPQVTFFKSAFRRYSPFVQYNVKYDIEDSLNFGETSYIQIPNDGDLLNGIQLEIDIPSLFFLKDDLDFQGENTNVDDSVVSEFDTVKNFLDLNVKAFQKAEEEFEATNVSANSMLASVQEIYNSSATLDGTDPNVVVENYENLISKDKNNSYYFFGSNINLLLDRLSQSNNSLTKQKILDICKNGINMSKMVIREYNKRYQNYQNLKNSEHSSGENFKYIKSRWVDNLGYAIIKNLEFVIGGEVIQRKTGLWLYIYHWLTKNSNQKTLLKKMVGDVDKLKKFDRNPKPEYKLIIPLDFWFSLKSTQAFPLCAIRARDLGVGINIELEKLKNCIYVEKPIVDQGDLPLDDLWKDRVNFLNSRICIDYILLGDEERRRFITHSHEYLIEDIQFNTFSGIKNRKFKADLNFRLPCKEIIWFAQREDFLENFTGYNKPMPTTFSFENDENPVKNSSFLINNTLRFDDKSFYNEYVVPYSRHSSSNIPGVNVKSFAEVPEFVQPTGFINLTPFKGVSLKINLKKNFFNYNKSESTILFTGEEDKEITSNARVIVIGVMINILRIVNGYAALGISS
jgi:hypothetical protein